jgi:hypothetical protein
VAYQAALDLARRQQDTRMEAMALLNPHPQHL